MKTMTSHKTKTCILVNGWENWTMKWNWKRGIELLFALMNDREMVAAGHMDISQIGHHS